MRLSDLVGQTRATTVLRTAIRREHVAHAYLFRGPSDVGKSTAAHLFAQALNCEEASRAQTGEGCAHCRSCQLIAAGSHPDVWVVTFMMEKGRLKTEISIHQIRRNPKKPGEVPRPIVQDAILKPVLGRHKIYLIDPADRMSDEAQNALLKLLEEPPPYAVLILVTSRPDILLPTTLSRCQHIAFQLAGTSAITAHLQTLGAEPDTAASLAALSGGRIGWAITAIRQPAVLAIRRDLLDLCARLPEYTVPQALRLAEEIKQQARVLAHVRAEQAEEGQGEEAETGETGTDRALRAELPWCLDVMALWYRDRMAAARGGVLVNPDYAAAIRAARPAMPPPERAVAALLAAKHQVQRNANLDLTLEALAIGLLGDGESARGPTRRRA